MQTVAYRLIYLWSFVLKIFWFISSRLWRVPVRKETSVVRIYG